MGELADAGRIAAHDPVGGRGRASGSRGRREERGGEEQQGRRAHLGSSETARDEPVAFNGRAPGFNQLHVSRRVYGSPGPERANIARRIGPRLVERH